MSELRDLLMKRDGLTFDQATDMVKEARERVLEGEDPEEILMDEFGLEPDYVMDLL